MNLLRPVKKWIFRKPSSRSAWLAGLEITQADIDSALFHPDLEPISDAPPTSAAPYPVGVTWYPEDVHA